MANEVKNNSQTIYVCEACGFGDKQSDWVERNARNGVKSARAVNIKITAHDLDLWPE
ncbi:MAG: hypothetical protein JSV77_08985 [Dehalococcoidales bacterium]|nr:MAG: hypothetical protein JSV77_08985 [Dehalococcoidales bacterium]